MKNSIFILLIGFLFVGCQNSSSPDDGITESKLTSDIEVTELDFVALKSTLSGDTEISDAEKEGLLHMREEEKLARDVYKFYSEKWDLRVFANITKSEETHMSAVKILIDQFELEDPIKEEGVFENETLQQLYNELTNLTADDIDKAIYNGLLIEDLDINDLQKLIDETLNEDIKIVYGNLLRGSENHLRAFYSQALKYEVEYSAQYISQENFDEIISASAQGGNGRRWKGGRK
ncbi:MAG: DUF2202 domain-containing protein [Melioribacteraceae bacterium]|nr:DUF2202 domain-containing protein [Melioribacteraceae bacterium]